MGGRVRFGSILSVDEQGRITWKPIDSEHSLLTIEMTYNQWLFIYFRERGHIICSSRRRVSNNEKLTWAISLHSCFDFLCSNKHYIGIGSEMWLISFLYLHHYTDMTLPSCRRALNLSMVTAKFRGIVCFGGNLGLSRGDTKPWGASFTAKFRGIVCFGGNAYYCMHKRCVFMQESRINCIASWNS